MKKIGGFEGNILVGNLLVGLGLGWLLKHYVPSTGTLAIGGGVILGAVSGIWQVLKRAGVFDSVKPTQGNDGKSDKP